MKASTVYKEKDQQVIKVYGSETCFLWSGFKSETEAKSAVINVHIQRHKPANDIEKYQAECDAEEFVNNCIWVEIKQPRQQALFV